MLLAELILRYFGFCDGGGLDASKRASLKWGVFSSYQQTWLAEIRTWPV